MANKDLPIKVWLDKDSCWTEKPQEEGYTEYIRKDAFIEKACDAYCKVCKIPNCRRNECKWISDFKGYLENIWKESKVCLNSATL